MDLRTFTETMPRGGMGAFAAKLGINGIYLSQLAARQNGREPSPALCVLIERGSGYVVRRWDLRPNDWHLIWPELIGTKGAPEVLAPVARRTPQPTVATEEQADSTAKA